VTDLTYNAPPTVSEFLDSDAFIRVIVGPVGSGKSSGCVLELLRRAMEQAPGPDGLRRTRWVVIRNTYGQLRDTTRKTFEQWFEPLIQSGAGKWREQSFTFEIEFEDVRSEVLFRALDRPEDKKKLLSLEVTGAYINEAREMPKEVFDVLQQRVGRYPSKMQGGPSWFGIWMDTNPWHTGHWGYKLFSVTKPDGHVLFEQPGGMDEGAENVENLPAGYYDRLCQGKDAEWVGEYVHSKYPVRDKGSIYGDLITAVEADGRVSAFEHETDGVLTSWDLGISDSTAIWWWRINGQGGLDFIDHYSANGKPMSHFFDELDKRPYSYVKHWLPHDARARTLVTGASPLDQMLERYPGKVAIGPGLSLEDGLQAGRWLLEQPVRFHSRVTEGMEALRAYRYAYDEDSKSFSRKPLHDWTSHTADAFRYAACVAKVSKLLTAQAVKTEPRVRSLGTHTLNEMYAMAKQGQSRRRV
jgi:hypothetical protein